MTTINGRFEMGKGVRTTSTTTWVVCYGYTDQFGRGQDVLVKFSPPVVYLHAAPKIAGGAS